MFLKKRQYLDLSRLAVMALALSLPLPCYALPDSAEPATQTEAVPSENDLLGLALKHPSAVENFYQQNKGKMLWTAGKMEKAQKIHNLLLESWKHGFNPAQYHVDEIGVLLQDKGLFSPSKKKLDMLVTDAVIHYGQDLTGMRVDPAKIKQKAAYWRQKEDPAQIVEAVSSASDPVKALEALGPQGKLYRLLQDELVALVAGANNHDDLLPLNFGKAIFRPGSRHAAVKSMRVILNAPHNPEQGPEDYYDDNLAAAVMKFQTENSLKADGAIGPKTLSLLNRTNKDKIDQIVANLERLRWMEKKRPDRYILVNIPSQVLWAIEDGDVALEMPVVVGKPQRQTQSFKTEVTGIRFNPTWTVPPGIKVKDMLPKLREDPYALSYTNINLYRDGRMVDPSTVDWMNISSRDLHSIKMVQDAGDNNALGYIRVLMPNEYDIYLHDTNHRELFEKDERFLSSGCVRVSQPRKLAHFILEKNDGWNDDKIGSYISSGKTREVSVAEKFPVYIVYQTVWLDEQGRLVYGPDIYNQDKKLVDVLKSMKEFEIPVRASSSDTENMAASTQ